MEKRDFFMPITVAQLNARLTTVLSPLLGRYQPVDEPAILVVTNIDTEPDRQWRVTGLECLIRRSSIRNPHAVTGGVCDRSNYQVELIQHDRSKNLDHAIDLVLKEFSRAKIKYQYCQTEEMEEQVCLLIPDDNALWQ